MVMSCHPKVGRILKPANRVAHGLLVLSLADGLKNQCAVRFDAIASLGWDSSFVAPVFAGDRISVMITVAAKRLTRRTDRGILVLEFSVINQDGRIVQKDEIP